MAKFMPFFSLLIISCQTFHCQEKVSLLLFLTKVPHHSIDGNILLKLFAKLQNFKNNNRLYLQLLLSNVIWLRD